VENQDNQWVEYLKTDKQVPRAVKAKEIIDVHKELKAKYPGVPIPNADRIVKTVSTKQQGAIKQEGKAY